MGFLEMVLVILKGFGATLVAVLLVVLMIWTVMLLAAVLNVVTVWLIVQQDRFESWAKGRTWL